MQEGRRLKTASFSFCVSAATIREGDEQDRKIDTAPKKARTFFMILHVKPVAGPEVIKRSVLVHITLIVLSTVKVMSSAFSAEDLIGGIQTA